MDASGFDRLVQVVGGGSRRTALRKALGGAALAAAGMVASATTSDAKTKKRKKKSKPPPPPLAFAVATVTSVTVVGSAAERRFECHFDWALVYPAGPAGLNFDDDQVEVAAATTEQQKRAAIVSHIRNLASQDLELGGFDVPADRIAVHLL